MLLLIVLFSLGMYFTDSKLSCMAILVQTNWESSLKRALEEEVSSRGGHFKWNMRGFLQRWALLYIEGYCYAQRYILEEPMQELDKTNFSIN